MTGRKYKQHIADLAGILKQKSIRNIILCPGSRNAPLIQVFQRDPFFVCTSIVDERSAGYIALGMAKQSGMPAVVVTTSGTATLNLGPAVAEAFYQHIPMIALTADRPPEYPPQFSNQRVFQTELFRNNCFRSVQLPREEAEPLLMHQSLSQVSALIDEMTLREKGPIHVNIPLDEPLYLDVSEEAEFEICETSVFHNQLTESNRQKYASVSEALHSGKKILILAGMKKYSEQENKILRHLSRHYQVSILAENLANLVFEGAINAPELVLAAAGETERAGLIPDMVMALGEQIVSKRSRLFVQGLENVPVILAERDWSTTLQDWIEKNPASDKNDNSYYNSWKQLEKRAIKKATSFAESAEFSNLGVVLEVLNQLPDNTVVHLGNSGTVRYSQLQAARPGLEYHSNRGTSGIDGCLSTAVGAALVSEKLHIAILGDLSFVYDSNAMWNKAFPKNLRIVVINDAGGGIFRLIDGPDRMSFFEEFSVTSHPVDPVKLAESFGLKTLTVKDYKQLQQGLNEQLAKNGSLQLVVAETSDRQNSVIFKTFYSSLQED